MKIIVDTSVLIDHLRGEKRAHALLAEAARSGHELWSVTPVRTEILAGMRDHERLQTLGLLNALRWLEVTVELADAAGSLARRFLRSHRGVDTMDYLVAAAVQHLEAQLYTLNIKHFPMFRGLRRPYD